MVMLAEAPGADNAVLARGNPSNRWVAGDGHAEAFRWEQVLAEYEALPLRSGSVAVGARAGSAEGIGG